MTPPRSTPAEEPEEVGIDELADVAREERAKAAPVPEQPTLDAPDPAPLAEVVEEAPLPAVVEQPDLPATPEADAGVLALIPQDDEWSDVADGDLAPGTRRIPYLKLNRNVGEGFTNPETGEKTTELGFVWLAKGKSRTWFDKEWSAKDTAPPSCRSADGLRADPQSPALLPGWDESPVKPTGDCSTCPLASYDEATRGGKDVKRCREAVEALVFIPDETGDGQLARLRWNGIALKPSLNYWDSFFTRMPKRPPIAYVSHVRLEPTATDFGDKLAPVFSRVTEIPRRAAEPLIRERDERVKHWQEDIAADVAEGVDGDIGDETTRREGPFDGAAAGPRPDQAEYAPDEEPF